MALRVALNRLRIEVGGEEEKQVQGFGSLSIELAISVERGEAVHRFRGGSLRCGRRPDCALGDGRTPLCYAHIGGLTLGIQFSDVTV
jgi:hypothetical protein